MKQSNINLITLEQKKVATEVVDRLNQAQKLVEQFPVTADMFQPRPPIISWGVCTMSSTDGKMLQKSTN